MKSCEFLQVFVLKVRTALKEIIQEISFKLVEAKFKKSQSHSINDA
jgi:hypothetical protein